MECKVVPSSNEQNSFMMNFNFPDNGSEFTMPAITAEEQLYMDIEGILYGKVILIICVFGI